MERQIYDVLGRLANFAKRTASGRGVGVPGFDTSAGIGSLPQPDRAASFFIQISDVDTSITPAKYSWIEVVRSNGTWVPPGDYRSGSSSSFPAYEATGSAVATVNSGSTMSAYPAWLSWDETSIEFVGPSSTGSATTIMDCRVRRDSDLSMLTGGIVSFDFEEYDTSDFYAPASPTILSVTTTGYYTFGCTLGVEVIGLPFGSAFPSDVYIDLLIEETGGGFYPSSVRVPIRSGYSGSVLFSLSVCARQRIISGQSIRVRTSTILGGTDALAKTGSHFWITGNS